ncbi:MAG: M48 family metalloprotease [Pseudomonadota bacterium]
MNQLLAHMIRIFMALALVASMVAPGHAARIALVRDAQTETLIRSYARPILRAANLRNGAVEILLVNDRSFNAFVTGRRMFINTGAIITSEVPNEIIGVIAHEVGHIEGGHQNRLRQRIEKAQVMSVLAGLLGAGIAVGSVAAGSADGARAGLGVAAGGRTAAIKDLLSYRRSEERAADIAALRLLNATGQSGNGLLETFRRFQSSLSLSGASRDKYKRSHPLPRARMAALEQDVANSPHFGKADSDALQLAHDLVRAKLIAYTGNSGDQARFAIRFRGTLPGLYHDAIATFLNGSSRAALPKIDAAIARAPRNPYLHEMKGEILLRSSRPREAVAAFQTAVKLDKTSNGFLRSQLGHALVELGDRASLQAAVKQLQRGLADDPNNPSGFSYLARAHAGLGQNGLADLASAQAARATGDLPRAKQLAKRAQQSLTAGSGPWLRAGDILAVRQ